MAYCYVLACTTCRVHREISLVPYLQLATVQWEGEGDSRYKRKLVGEKIINVISYRFTEELFC